MAISALHIAYLRTSDAYAYRLLALHHANRALPVIRTAITCMNEDNCHAIYTSVHMVLKYAFATPDWDLFFSDEGRVVSEWLVLMRGAVSVTEMARNWLCNGPFSSSLDPPIVINDDVAGNPEDFRFTPVKLALDMLEGEDGVHCREALRILRRLMCIAATTNPSTITMKAIVLEWPHKISQRFIALVNERKPEALLVVAHYSLLVGKIRHFWYMKGSTAWILHQCGRYLGPEWHSFLDWPMAAGSEQNGDESPPELPS